MNLSLCHLTTFNGTKFGVDEDSYDVKHKEYRRQICLVSSYLLTNMAPKHSGAPLKIFASEVSKKSRPEGPSYV